MKQLGKITHYYGKIGVAIIKLSGVLKVGDKIKIQNKSGEFEQAVDSIQVEHAGVSSAKKGQEVGVKVSQKATEGSAVYKAEE